MQGDEAKTLLGFPPHSYPSTSQIKAAYRKKVWETHPDRFPNYEKVQAECKFKLISEAYSFLLNSVSYTRVVRSGVPRSPGGRRNLALTSVPFFLIVLGAFTLGGSTAARAYRKQKESCASYNPFLP
ncbi:chaperone protein DnaJ isoform X2 [Olea europaea var. sylvestris]|uniref:chaperone protein DnaJ isoform X2 n=1 Tax=Olea europaea var. sylvestris TaxID=158386 RepID=UPI000C1D1A65|nr:chaperone protein DnaJ isoform X2 [Olea europaea var. sylvestris]